MKVLRVYRDRHLGLLVSSVFVILGVRFVFIVAIPEVDQVEFVIILVDLPLSLSVTRIIFTGITCLNTVKQSHAF